MDSTEGQPQFKRDEYSYNLDQSAEGQYQSKREEYTLNQPRPTTETKVVLPTMIEGYEAPSYVVRSAVAMIFCCLPIGLAALLYSLECRMARIAGRKDYALQVSEIEKDFLLVVEHHDVVAACFNRSLLLLKRFLVAETQLYERLCPSVRCSVSRLVCWSVGLW